MIATCHVVVMLQERDGALVVTGAGLFSESQPSVNRDCILQELVHAQGRGGSYEEARQDALSLVEQWAEHSCSWKKLREMLLEQEGKRLVQEVRLMRQLSSAENLQASFARAPKCKACDSAVTRHDATRWVCINDTCPQRNVPTYVPGIFPFLIASNVQHELRGVYIRDLKLEPDLDRFMRGHMVVFDPENRKDCTIAVFENLEIEGAEARLVKLRNWIYPKRDPDGHLHSSPPKVDLRVGEFGGKLILIEAKESTC